MEGEKMNKKFYENFSNVTSDTDGNFKCRNGSAWRCSFKKPMDFSEQNKRWRLVLHCKTSNN